MKHLTCSSLLPDCDAEFEGSDLNDIVLQYVLHSAHSHRRKAVTLADLLQAITTVERRAVAA